MGLYIVAINGSPHKNGNTAFLLNEILENLAQKGADTKIIHAQSAVLSSKSPYCTACSMPCNKSCFVGTELEIAYENLAKADAIILGSPVYFGTVSAQIKAFFDKARSIRGSFTGKLSVAVSCGGARFGGQETTVKALHDIALVHGMTIIGDGSRGTDAGHHGVCAQAPANEDANAVKRAEITANRILEELR